MNLWQELKSAAKDLDTSAFVRLILQILNATAGSEARFSSFRSLVGQHEARLLAAGEGLDTVQISEIVGLICRAMFAIHHEGQPMAECEKLILILKRSGNELDTILMAHTFERLYYHCKSKPPTAMNFVGSENITMARERVAAAVAISSWDEITASVTDMMWSLAEARPDFEELPNWIREGEAATSTVELSRRASAVVKNGHEIVRNVAHRYGNNSDELRLAQAEAKFTAGQSQVPIADYAIFLADALQTAVQFHDCVRRLPVTIEAGPLGSRKRICIGRHTHISFNRTLRIPEDGKAYPLPAGFGRLPILRVEDYAERVPAKWLEDGGFIIPLYQREALFLEFEGVEWRPTIVKVAVGRVNAVSGKAYDLSIRPHRQDYVVIPDQHWLDGINSGAGSVNQFVAMPLGEGYTIEAQITEEEKHGGFQLAVFDPKPERFPDIDPELQAAAESALIGRARVVGQHELLRMLPEDTLRLIKALKKKNYADVASDFELAEEDVLTIAAGVRQQFEEKLGKYGFDGVVPSCNLEREDQFLYASSPVGDGTLLKSQALMAAPRPGAAAVTEMGIAAGGRIKQQIVEDTYGAESWDQTAIREVIVHIVNSAVFKELTGKEPPPTAITHEEYQKYGIPWYSDYDEQIPKVAPPPLFRRILSIGQIDRKRGNKLGKTQQSTEVKPEQILRIRTPDSRERLASFVERARASVEIGRYRIAAREATMALDLEADNSLAYLIRAEANHHLGFHADAEADASACIKRKPGEHQAFKIRALSCLALGEVFLAKNDAESVLRSDPDDEIGIYVRAEANLRLENYADAISDADRLLRRDNTHPEALRIRLEACKRSGLLPL